MYREITHWKKPVTVVGEGFGGTTDFSIKFCMPITLSPCNLPSPTQQSGGTEGYHRDHTLF